MAFIVHRVVVSYTKVKENATWFTGTFAELTAENIKAFYTLWRVTFCKSVKKLDVTMTLG